jgi:conjugative transposon TraM protein
VADTLVEKYADHVDSHYQPPHPGGVKTDTDANEQKVYRKLAQLNQQLDQSKLQDAKSDRTNNAGSMGNAATVNTSDINRLESMMQNMQGGNGGADPEMQQISGMLEKILDIQHPERVQDKIQQQSKKNQQAVYPVSIKDEHTGISLLEGKLTDTGKSFLSGQQNNAFYSLGEFTRPGNEQQDAVSAMIPETQVLVNGATVKVQLTSEVYINGLLIPVNQLVYGIAALDGERLTININSIRYQHSILPVALSVYDMDGIAGIYIPDAITRDVTKQSTDQAIQSVGLASLDPSVGAQAASVGIQAAKSLIGRKVKLVKVTVKAGYRVLLRDNKATESISN